MDVSSESVKSQGQGMFSCSKGMEADWSEIQTDLLSLIVSKLDVHDRVCFRSVSKSWRRSICPFPRPRWLLLYKPKPDNVDKQCTSTVERLIILPRGFTGFAEKKFSEINLAQAQEREIIGCIGILLTTIGKDGLINLFNPFTKIQIQLPSVKTMTLLPGHKIILSSFSSTRYCIATATHNFDGGLYFATPGDLCWTRCGTSTDSIANTVLYKQKIYAINNFGEVRANNITDFHSSSILMPDFRVKLAKNASSSIYSDIFSGHKFYLVEWMGELLLVIKMMDIGYLYYGPIDQIRLRMERMKITEEEIVLYRTKDIKIYKLDFSKRNWDELKDLGEYSLFLGRKTSVSILASYHEGIKRNCVYFTDDCLKFASSGDIYCGRDMGVFDMKKKDIQPYFRDTSTNVYSPPIWLIPDSLAAQN